MSKNQNKSKQLSQISRTLNQRRILKRNLDTKKMLELGLFEKAAEMQKPITDAVALSSEENRKELESLRNTIDAAPKNPKLQFSIHPLNVKQEAYGNKYVPSESTRFSWNGETFQKWKIGKTDGYVFVKKDDKQLLHNMDIRDYPETELTEGLYEILFNNAQNKNKIQPSDIQIWE